MKTIHAMLVATILLALSSISAQANIFDDASALASRYSDAKVCYVIGESMRPALSHADIVVIKTDFSELKIGQQCVYKNSAGEYLLRVVASVHPLAFCEYAKPLVGEKPATVSKIVGVVYGVFKNVNNCQDVGYIDYVVFCKNSLTI